MATDYSTMSGDKWEKVSRSLLHSTGIDRRAQVMKEAHEVLSLYGVKHWLAMSALLGIFREGDLLERDEDVDFYCLAEQLTEQCIANLKGHFLSIGYDVHGNVDKARLEVFKDGECVSFMGHFLERGHACRCFKNRLVPVSMFSTDPSHVIHYRGVNYPCMWPVKKYLQWQYKDWKKPYYGPPEDRDRYMNKRKVVR